MRTIWKFELAPIELQTFPMPKHAEILSVQYQGESLCLWAFVETTAKKENRTFVITGTGIEISDTIEMRYIGTVQTPLDFTNSKLRLVWHVFEKCAL